MVEGKNSQLLSNYSSSTKDAANITSVGRTVFYFIVGEGMFFDTCRNVLMGLMNPYLVICIILIVYYKAVSFVEQSHLKE